MYTSGTLEHPELGKLNIAMNWHTETLYLSARDLAWMLKTSIHECLMEHFDNDLHDIVVTVNGGVYFKATAVLATLSKYDSDRFHQVSQWLREVIIPQFQCTKGDSTMSNTEMMNRAKQVSLDHLNATRDEGVSEYTLEDMYIVWFCKTIQNWKALVSTDVVDGLYYEITYNGDKDKTYVDVYTRFQHITVDGENK